MREERPMTDTTHDLLSVYRAIESGEGSEDGRNDERDEVAVRGRLLDSEGTALFGFLDVHEFVEGDADAEARIAATYTYTR
jgi:hypothetical protein